MNSPFIAFFWGVAGIFFGGQIVDTDTTLGYIIGIPICILGFLALKHLGQRLIFISSLKVACVGIIALFGGVILANVITAHYISQLIVAVGLSVTIAAGIQVYYKNMY